MDRLKKFMNIWEIEGSFKCPVVGAMLSVDKHKSILKKCGWDVSSLKPYEYHTAIMGCLADENTVSVKVNNFIRHQARHIMADVIEVYANESGDAAKKKVRNLWESWAVQGDIGPAMYALVSHEDADIELLRDIHGEVHMLSHANMTEVFHIRKKINAANDSLAREKKRVAEKNHRIRELVSDAKTSSRTLSCLEQENAKLKKQVSLMDAGPVPKSVPGADLKDRVAALEAALEQEKKRTAAAEDMEKKVCADLFRTQNENQLLKEELETMVASFPIAREPAFCPAMAQAGTERQYLPQDQINCPEKGACGDKSCPNYMLCARRIFMIGGITKMKAHYRELVEKAGGEFDYHDGYMKSAGDNLAAKVRRCDIVVCPVSCNSHNACLKVKKLCQRYNKELKILNSASLSAVTQALFIPETASVN